MFAGRVLVDERGLDFYSWSQEETRRDTHSVTAETTPDGSDVPDYASLREKWIANPTKRWGFRKEAHVLKLAADLKRFLQTGQV